MDPESASGTLEPTKLLVGAGTNFLTSSPIIPGMKMEFPGPPAVYGHGFGPPATLVLESTGHLALNSYASIQSPYTPGRIHYNLAVYKFNH